MTKSIDFDRVARYYDAHVTTTVDLPFWLEVCRRTPPPHLELMCGTGRITLAILRAGVELTAVDYAQQLLDELRIKLAAEPSSAPAELIAADVRELRLERRFGCIFIGFHAVAELSELDDLRRALARIAALLDVGGSVWISMHEPHVRGPQCDGAWVELGRHPLASGGSVEIRGRWQLTQAPDDGLVVGQQVYVERDDDGRERERVELPVRFRLWSAATLAREAAAVGLRLHARHDGYAVPLRPADADSRMSVLELVSDETARARAG